MGVSFKLGFLCDFLSFPGSNASFPTEKSSVKVTLTDSLEI